MNYLILILLCLFVSSCGDSDFEPQKEKDQEAVNVESKVDKTEVVWVCHHPGTKFHNEVCVEDFFPDGCYVKNDPYKFCWILPQVECESEERRLPACAVFD